ncbi:hypothetical protein [Paenibacillus sp. FSL L8-0494]|uniref:hypothetical protein n=1 Tax=Paenibacillus sp. FSL L8-0494 TaxID=2975352 RepID=UPI0030F83B7A
MDKVISAIKRIRCHVLIDEYKLHGLIADQLNAAEISFKNEVLLAPHNRIDFIAGDGIGIEAKKGKPNEQQVLRQLERYAAFDKERLILVIERYMDLPEMINGKPVVSIGLRKLWGISSK